MSGLITNGLASLSLPLTGNERFYCDTGYANGTSPQSVALSALQMGTIGLGAVQSATDAATIAVDVSKGSQFAVTLGATGRTLTMSNPAPGQVVTAYVKQDATGSRTITTYTNVLWAAGTAPTLTVTAGALDVLRFTWSDALGKWIGETVGKAYA